VNKGQGEGRWVSRWGDRWGTNRGGDRWGENPLSKNDEVFVERHPPQRIEVYLDDSMKQSDNVEAQISNPPTQSLALDGSRESLSEDLDNNRAKFKILLASIVQIVKLFSTAANKAAGSGRRSARVRRAPGALVLDISEFLFSPKTLRMVVNPIIADMQVEYFAALAAGQRYKAIWICVRGYWSLVKALGLFSLVRTVAEVWRKISI
jgi:hypothetical protein